jgi:alpha-N-arabinofuranosidase
MHLNLFLSLSLAAVLMPSVPHGANADESGKATLKVEAAKRAAYPIPKNITGKFAEHLGNNIYNGMDAQILRNATFADFPIWSGQTSPDGVATFQYERDKITQEIQRRAARLGWPDSESRALSDAYFDGLAGGWGRVGSRENVEPSPDSGPHIGRAQRIQVKAAGCGIGQWNYLPLHRVRVYEFEMSVRSLDLTELTVSLTSPILKELQTPIKGIGPQWKTFTGRLEVPATVSPDTALQLAITANRPGQFVIARMLLRPADHIGGADPDVIRLLRDSHLPILRWPGGNFVSGYHWRDGVGPMEKRPTLPNYAWGGVEPNTFGTDEFIAFCRQVGCEPMICVNGGNGTPDEAAQWIEYCNGPASSPMGALRAANGHAKPYNIRHWEVGNELWGKWQVHWTTASGYVDRYKEFSRAMLAADPAIDLYACGAPVMWGKQWNDTMLEGIGGIMNATTDHPLVGGDVSPSAEPLDVYRDFMAVPNVLEMKWEQLQQDMAHSGAKHPRLAVTELQMFAHIGQKGDGERRLTPDKLVNPATQAEAIYDILLYHASIRLAPFVDMITHSAIVNHGGGLRKEHERVYANPCHYAQSAFAEFADATPVPVQVKSALEKAPMVLPELKRAVPECAYEAIDALAAIQPGGDLLLSIVHKGTAGPIDLAVELAGFKSRPDASVRTLAADVPWAANSLQNPELVKPVDSSVAVIDGKMVLPLKPYSVTHVRIKKSL